MNDDFFGNAPEDYEVPGGESRYMKLQQGDNKFRILQKPIFGWEGWKTGTDGKDTPVRFKLSEKPADASSFRNGRINHFWAMPVWNFQTKQVELLQLTQKTILKPIENNARSEDWGSPLGYSITVHKEGTTKEDTNYVVSPTPHKEVPDEVKAEWQKVLDEGFDLNELYTNGDPFAPSTKAAEEQPAPSTDEADTTA